MKATQFIKVLEQAIEDFGDQEVVISDSFYGQSPADGVVGYDKNNSPVISEEFPIIKIRIW
ncbi:MAG: hypothetical protein JKY45_03210 [Emcibacter sp.]|nr:hypothetical protein [Emcibacter sp.]